jgi:hypothetical protein
LHFLHGKLFRIEIKLQTEVLLHKGKILQEIVVSYDSFIENGTITSLLNVLFGAGYGSWWQ